MKRRISIWATVGFLVACGWVLYSFVMPPDHFIATMRQPLVEAAVITSCPICFAGRYFPLSFWAVPLINAATYAVVGLLVEALVRRKRLAPIR